MGEDVERAVAALERGGVVVVPTDTVYGLAARPEAADRIVALKQRDPNKSMQLLVPDASWLARYARASERAEALARAFWPGPLTIVLRASDDAPEQLTTNGTIGLRAPDHLIAQELLARAGPLAASSANLAGEQTPHDVDAIRALFGDGVDAYLDGGRIAGTGSTVVDVSGSEPVVLRVGAIAEIAIKRTLGEGRFEAH